jgi:hypothetical protein
MAAEQCDEAIADEDVERAAVARHDGGEHAAHAHQRRHGARFVLAHEPTETGHVGEEDAMQAAGAAAGIGDGFAHRLTGC